MKLFHVLCTAIVICAINQSSTGRSLERTKRDAEEDEEQETQSYTEDAEGITEESAIDRRFITMNRDNRFNMVVQKSHDFSAHYDNEDETSSESIVGNNNDINELLNKLQSNMASNKDVVFPSGMDFSNVNDLKSSNVQDILQSMMNQNEGQLNEQSIKNIMSMMGGGQENGAQLSFQQPTSFNLQDYKPNMAGSSANTASVDLESIIEMLAQQYNIGAEEKNLLKSQMKHMDSEQLQQLLNMVTMFGGAQGQVTMNEDDVTPQFDGSQITMSQDEMADLFEMLQEKGYTQESPSSPIQIEQSQLEELLKMIKLKMKGNGGDEKYTEQTKDVKHQIDIEVSDESPENIDAGNVDMEQLMKLLMSLQGGGETAQLNIDPRILQMLMKISAGLPKSPAGLTKEMAVNLNPDLLKYLLNMMKNKPKQKLHVEEPADAGGDGMDKFLQLLQSGKPQYKKPMQAEVGKPSHDDMLKLLQMFGPKAKGKDKVIQIRIPGNDKPAPVETDWDTDNILDLIQKNPQILGGLQPLPKNGELPDWLLKLLKNLKKKPSRPEPQQEIGPQDNEEHDEVDTNLPDEIPELADILKLFNKPKKPNYKPPFYNKDENLPDTNTDGKQPDLSDIWKLLKSFGTTPAPFSKYPNNMPSSGKKPGRPSNPVQPEDNDANLPVSKNPSDLSSLLKDLFNFDNDKKTTPRPNPNNWPKFGPGSVPFRPDRGQVKYPNKHPEEGEENLPVGHSPDNSSGGYSYGSEESKMNEENDEDLPLQHPTANTPSNNPYGPQYPYETTTEIPFLSKIFDFLNPTKHPEENDENLPLDHSTEEGPYRPRYPQETNTQRPSLSKILFKLLKPNEEDVNLPMTQPTEQPNETPYRPLYPVESTTQPNLTNLILTLLNPTYNPEEETESEDDWYPATTKKPSLSDIFGLFNPDKNKKPNNHPEYRPNYPTPSHDPSSPDFFNPLNIYSPEREELKVNGDYPHVHHKTTTHVIKIVNITGEQPAKTNRPRFPEHGAYITNNTSSVEEPDQNNNILKQIFDNLNLDRFNRTKPPKRPQPIRPSIPFQPPTRPPGTTNLLNRIMQYLIDKNKYEINDSTTKHPIILPVPTIEPDRNPLNKEIVAPYSNSNPPNQPREIDVYFPHYKDSTIIAPYETEAVDDKGRPVSPEWLPQIDKAVYLANKFFPNQVTDVLFMPESSNDNVGLLPSISELIRSSISGDKPEDALAKNPKRDTLLKRLIKTILSSSLPSTTKHEYPEEGLSLTRFVKELVKSSFPEYVQPTYPPRGDIDPNLPSSLFDRNITNLQHLDSPFDVLRDFLKLAIDAAASDPLKDEDRLRMPSLVRIILSMLRSNSPMEDFPSKPSPLWPFGPKRPSIYQLSLTKTIINLLRSEFSTANPLEDSQLLPKPWTPSHSKPKDESMLDHLLPLFDSKLPSRDKDKHPFLPGDSEEDPLQPSGTRRPSIFYLLSLPYFSIPSTDKNKYPFHKDSAWDELFNPDRQRTSLLKSVMNMLLKSSDSNYPSDSSSDWPDLWHSRPWTDKKPNDRHKSILHYVLLLLQSSLKPLQGGVLKHIQESLLPGHPLDSIDDLWPENWSPKLLPDTALPMWERFTQLTSFAPTALTGILSMLYSGSPSSDPWTDTPSKPNADGLIPSPGSTYDRPSPSDDPTPGTEPKEKPSNWVKEITSTSSMLGERPSKIPHFPWPLNIPYPKRNQWNLKPRNDVLSMLDSSTPWDGKQNNRPFADPNKKPKDRKDKPKTTLDYLLPFFDSSTPSSIFDDSPSSGKKPESIPSKFIKTIFSFSILHSVHILPTSVKKLYNISRLPETDLPDSLNKRPGTPSKRPSLTRDILSILRSNPSDDPSTSNTPELGKRESPLRHIWRSIKDISNYVISNPRNEPRDKYSHSILDLLRPVDPFDIFNWPRDKPDMERNPLLPKYDSENKKRPSFITSILSILLSNSEPSNWLNPLSPSKPTDRTRPSLTDEILSFLGSNPNRNDPVTIPSRDTDQYPLLPKYDPYLPKYKDSILKRILNLLRSSGPDSPFDIFIWQRDKPDSTSSKDREQNPLLPKHDPDIPKPTDTIFKRILYLLRSSYPESPSKQSWQLEDSFDIFNWPRDKSDNIPSRYRERYPVLKRPSLFRSILSILRSDSEPSNWLDPLFPSNQRPDSMPRDRSRPSLTDEILSFLGSNPIRDDPVPIPSTDEQHYPLLPKYDSRNEKRPSFIRTILSILLSHPERGNWLDPFLPSNQRPDSKPTDRSRPSLTDEILSFLGSNPNSDDPLSIPSRDRERYPLLPKYEPYLPKPTDSIFKRILSLLRSSYPESPSKQNWRPEDPFGIFNWPRDKPDSIPFRDREQYPLLPKYDSKTKKRPSFTRTILSVLRSNTESINWLDPISPSNQKPDSMPTDRTRPSLTHEILSFLVSNPSRDDPASKLILENTFDFPKTTRRPSLFKDILTAFDSSRILPDDLLPGRDKKYPEFKPSLPDVPKREKKPSVFGDILLLLDSSRPSTDKGSRPSSISDILIDLNSNSKRDELLFPSTDFSWLPEWLGPKDGDKLYGQITFDKISEICNKLMKIPSVIPSAITNIFGPLDDNIDPAQALWNLLKPSSSTIEKKDFPSLFPSWHELFTVSVEHKSDMDLFKPKPDIDLFPFNSDVVGTSKNPFKELKDLFKLPDLERTKISFSLSRTVLRFLTKLTTDPWSLNDDDDIKNDSRLVSLIQKISRLNISDRQKIYECLRLKTMLPTLIEPEKEEIDCDLVKVLMKLKFPKLSEAEINNLIAQQVSNHLLSMTNDG